MNICGYLSWWQMCSFVFLNQILLFQLNIPSNCCFFIGCSGTNAKFVGKWLFGIEEFVRETSAHGLKSPAAAAVFGRCLLPHSVRNDRFRIIHISFMVPDPDAFRLAQVYQQISFVSSGLEANYIGGGWWRYRK